MIKFGFLRFWLLFFTFTYGQNIYASQSFDVNAKMIGFNADQEKKVLKAIELIKKVVASEEFKNRVLQKQFNGAPTYFDNAGLSNEQVYEKIMEASEMMAFQEKNNVMDVELELYQDTSKTVGYTYPNVVRIWMNNKYFEKFQPHEVADNLFHEWLHKIGFTHELNHSPTRPHSVPYSLGYLVKELAQKYQN